MNIRSLLAFGFAALVGGLPPSRAAALDQLPPGAFTVVVIPDTQGYDGNAAKRAPAATTNPVFDHHTRWIVENLKAQNIVFVSHVGDIVDINNHTQWKLARGFLDRLHGAVPYGLCVGNHDMQEFVDGDASLFQRYFGADRFQGFAWYGGCFEPDRPNQAVSGNNANSYQLFSAGGLDFIHLNLECNPPDDVLAWANALLEKHAARRAMISTHMDLGPMTGKIRAIAGQPAPLGRMQWLKIAGNHRNTPQQMWEKLYSKHANLGFVFSGDQRSVTAFRLSGTGEHGNTVHQLTSDYTSSGPLRLYRFIPAENRVQVVTYDTTTKEVVTDTQFVHDVDQHQFSLRYAMTGAPSKSSAPASQDTSGAKRAP